MNTIHLTSGSTTCKHRLNMEWDLQSLFGLRVHSCTVLSGIWAHMRGRYWSAITDDISLWPPACKSATAQFRKRLLSSCWRSFRCSKQSKKGADPPTLPERVANGGRNHLNEEITPLLPTGMGERYGQTISNLGHAAPLRRCEIPLWTEVVT
jgi:hypothetical protein